MKVSKIFPPRRPSVYGAMLSGLLMGSALVWVFFWWAYLLGFIYLLSYILPAHNHGTRVKLTLIAFITKSAVTLVWFFSAIPLVWASALPTVLQVGIVFLYWIPTACMIGLGAIVLGFCIRYIPKHKPLLAAVCVGILLVLSDLLGSFLFSLYLLGAESSVNVLFSMGYAGLSLAHIPGLVLLAKFGGVYVLTFVVGVSGYLMYSYRNVLIPKNNTYYIALYMLCIVTLTFVSVHAQERSAQTEFTGDSVAVVQTDFAFTTQTGFENIERKRAIEKALRSALASGASYIIFPEGADVTGRYTPDEFLAFLATHKTTENVVVVDSEKFTTDTKTVLRAHIYDTKGATVYDFDKQYLVPQGEYVPYIYKKLLLLLSKSDALETRLDTIAYQPGINQQTRTLPEYVPNVLFCFESINPIAAKTTKTERTPFFAHLVSHTWFHRAPHTFWNQLDTMLRVQAVWSEATIIQSGNKTDVAVYRPNGTREALIWYDASDLWSVWLVGLDE